MNVWLSYIIWIMLSLLVLMLAFNGALGLTGQASASLCHCDLTQGFCDIGCCCDNDCGTVKNN